MPPVEDDGLHVDELADGALVYFQFPLEVDAAPGDVLLVREKAVRLMGRCGNHHPAVAALRAYVFAHYDAAFAAEWLSGRQVWSTRVLDDAARAKLSIRKAMTMSVYDPLGLGRCAICGNAFDFDRDDEATARWHAEGHVGFVCRWCAAELRSERPE